MKVVLASALMASLLGTGCTKKPVTAMLIEVRGDLLVPQELDQVRIEVESDRTPTQKTTVSLVDTPPRDDLYATAAVHPAGADTVAFTVRAIGLRGGNELVRQSARVTFLAGERSVLTLWLERSCVAAPSTCTDESTTCYHGDCVTPDEVGNTARPFGQDASVLDTSLDKDASVADVREAGSDTAADAPAGSGGSGSGGAGSGGSGSGGAGSGGSGSGGSGSGGSGGGGSGSGGSGSGGSGSGGSGGGTCNASSPLPSYGYYASGDWHGYVTLYKSQASIVTTPADFSGTPTNGSFCVTATIPYSEGANTSVALIFYLAQFPGKNCGASSMVPTGTGIQLTVDSKTPVQLVLALEDEGWEPFWYDLGTASGTFTVPFSDMKAGETAYNPQTDGARKLFVYASSTSTTQDAELCVSNLVQTW